MASEDEGSLRWSAFTFHTQLLPGTVPVAVLVMERFDAARALRHQAARAALRRSADLPPSCPSCGHDLTVDTAGAAPAPAETPAAPEPPAAAAICRAVPDATVTATAGQRMRMLVEAIAGRRPLAQLAKVAAPPVQRYARVEADRLRHQHDTRSETRAGGRRAAGTARLRSVHVTEVRADVVELCGLLELAGVPLLAYAGRLQRRGTPSGIVWTITALRILRPAPTVTTRRPGRTRPPGWSARRG